MPTEAETLKEIQRLLANGETQAAADLASQAEVEAQKAADLAAGKPAEPPPPRDPNTILMDFMSAVASRFGQHRELLLLVDEMDRALHGKEKSPEEPAPKA
jgi:hypothetical protein